MAMKTRVGLYWRLKDKTLPWDDRVKLARYIWKEDSVKFPNKEQVVLDWVCLVLSGKIRVPDEESKPVWKCLRDVSQTTKCQCLRLQNQTLTLKSSLVQVMLEKLKNRSKLSDDIVEYIIHSFYYILKSPQLSPVISSKYEYSLQLCAHTVEIMGSNQDTLLQPILKDLMVLSAQQLQVAQRIRATPQQVLSMTCQTLLLPACKLIVNESSAETMEVEKTLLDALLSKDIETNYEAYLKQKGEKEQGKSSVIKTVELLFTKLREGAKIEETRRGTLSFLPRFLSCFVKTYGTNPESAAGFQMFICLVSLTGLQYNAESKVITSSIPPQSGQDIQLKTLLSLLHVVLDENIYNMATDAALDNRHLTYFKSLADWILQHKTRCCDWFGCIELLLKLNYMIFEPKLIKLLQTSWTSSPELAEDADVARGRMLCELVTVHSRLRQIPRLVTRLLAAARGDRGVRDSGVGDSGAGDRGVGEGVRVPFPVRAALADVISSLPQTVITSIWEELLNFLVALSEEKISKDNQWSFILVSDLLCILLWNAHLADYSITTITTKAIEGLMTRMAHDLLKPLVVTLLESKEIGDFGVSVLSLLCVWGDFHVMQSQYNLHYSRQGSFINPADSLPCKDLSFTFPFVGRKQAERLWLLSSKQPRAAYTYLLSKLVCLDLNAMMIMGDKSEEIQDSIVKRLVYVYEQYSESPAPSPAATWNQEITDITEDNLPVALWSLVLSYLPGALDVCTEHQISSISRDIVQTLTTSSSEVTKSVSISRRNVSESFLASDMFKELSLIHVPFCQAIFSEIQKTLFKKAKSPKKQKKEFPRALDALLSTLTTLTTAEFENPTTFGPLINNVLGQAIEYKLTPSQVDIVVRLLELMKAVPLDSTSPPLQAAVITVCIALLISSTSENVQTSSIDVLLLTSAKIPAFLPGIAFGKLLTHISSWESSNKENVRKFQDEVLRQVLRSEEGLFKCNTFISDSLDNLKKKTKSFHDVRTALQIFRIIGENVSKTYLSEHVRERSQQHFTRVYPHFLDLVQSIKPSSPIGISQQVLGAYSRQLIISKNDADTEKLVECLPNMCNVCVEVMSNDANTTLDQECLNFVRIICDYKEKFGDAVPPDFLVSCRSRVLSALERGHPDTTTGPMDTDAPDTSSTDQDQDQDQDQDGLYLCAVRLMNFSDTAEYRSTLINLLKCVKCGVSIENPQKISMVLTLWRYLVVGTTDDEKCEVLKYYSQQLVGQLHEFSVMLSTCNIDRNISVSLSREILDLQTHLLTQGPTLLQAQAAVQTLHAGHLVPLQDLSIPEFSQIVHGIHGNLNALIITHTETALKVIPTIMANSSRLLKHVIHEGRQRETELPAEEVDTLVTCAQLIDRLCGLMLHHKVDFARVALYLVADYTNHVQKVTLIPKVKNALLPAIYSLLNLCDTHAIAQLHTVLPTGVKEIFKTVYDQYLRYHKYSGRV